MALEWSSKVWSLDQDCHLKDQIFYCDLYRKKDLQNQRDHGSSDQRSMFFPSSVGRINLGVCRSVSWLLRGWTKLLVITFQIQLISLRKLLLGTRCSFLEGHGMEKSWSLFKRRIEIEGDGGGCNVSQFWPYLYRVGIPQEFRASQS